MALVFSFYLLDVGEGFLKAISKKFFNNIAPHYKFNLFVAQNGVMKTVTEGKIKNVNDMDLTNKQKLKKKTRLPKRLLSEPEDRQMRSRSLKLIGKRGFQWNSRPNLVRIMIVNVVC